MWSAITLSELLDKSVVLRRARRRPDQILEQVDLVIAVHLLHHCGNALQPHAGIDRRLGQRMQCSRAVPVVLHEHQVPDFDVAVAVRLGRARRAARNFRHRGHKKFREQGPQGPVSPICQKLSMGGDAGEARASRRRSR